MTRIVASLALSAFAAQPAFATGYYRGAEEGATAHQALQSHGGEYKCRYDKTNKRVIRRGLSVFNDPKKLPARFGRNVFHVDTLPHGLELLVVGSPGHAEVVPLAADCSGQHPLTLRGYQERLLHIKLTHSGAPRASTVHGAHGSQSGSGPHQRH